MFCALISITAHQRQINNSIKSKDIVLSEITRSAIFTDLKFTVCHNNLHAKLGSIFCVTHAEITGICHTLLLLLLCKWRQGGAADVDAE